MYSNGLSSNYVKIPKFGSCRKDSTDERMDYDNPRENMFNTNVRIILNDLHTNLSHKNDPCWKGLQETIEFFQKYKKLSKIELNEKLNYFVKLLKNKEKYANLFFRIPPMIMLTISVAVLNNEMYKYLKKKNVFEKILNYYNDEILYVDWKKYYNQIFRGRNESCSYEKIYDILCYHEKFVTNFFFRFSFTKERKELINNEKLLKVVKRMIFSKNEFRIYEGLKIINNLSLSIGLYASLCSFLDTCLLFKRNDYEKFIDSLKLIIDSKVRNYFELCLDILIENSEIFDRRLKNNWSKKFLQSELIIFRKFESLCNESQYKNEMSNQFLTGILRFINILIVRNKTFRFDNELMKKVISKSFKIFNLESNPPAIYLIVKITNHFKIYTSKSKDVMEYLEKEKIIEKILGMFFSDYTFHKYPFVLESIIYFYDHFNFKRKILDCDKVLLNRYVKQFLIIFQRIEQEEFRTSDKRLIYQRLLSIMRFMFGDKSMNEIINSYMDNKYETSIYSLIEKYFDYLNVDDCGVVLGFYTVRFIKEKDVAQKVLRCKNEIHFKKFYELVREISLKKVVEIELPLSFIHEPIFLLTTENMNLGMNVPEKITGEKLESLQVNELLERNIALQIIEIIEKIFKGEKFKNLSMFLIRDTFLQNNSICDTCKKTEDKKKGIKLQKCGRCKVRYYCSKDCQKKDWKIHKKNCLKYKE